MSARSDVLSLPRSGRKAGNRAAWAVLGVLVAGAVAAAVVVSTRSTPVAPSKPLKDQAVTKVTGTGPGLAVIGQEWALHGQALPAITGTGPDLSIAASIGAADATNAAAIEQARAAIQHRVPTGAVTAPDLVKDANTPAQERAKQLAR